MYSRLMKLEIYLLTIDTVESKVKSSQVRVAHSGATSTNFYTKGTIIVILLMQSCTSFTAAAEGAGLALYSYDTLKSSKKLQVDLQLHDHVKKSNLQR